MRFISPPTSRQTFLNLKISAILFGLKAVCLVWYIHATAPPFFQGVVLKKKIFVWFYRMEFFSIGWPSRYMQCFDNALFHRETGGSISPWYDT